jgi:hypothetical protein
MNREKPVAQAPENVPRVFTARYLAQAPERTGAVPVRVSMRAPLIPLPYALEETA